MSMQRIILLLAIIGTIGLLNCESAEAQHSAGFGGAQMADSPGSRAASRTPSMSGRGGGISRARMRRRPPRGSLSLGGTRGMQDNPHFASLPTLPGSPGDDFESSESAVDRASRAIQERQRAATSRVRSFQIGRVGGGSARAD